jgi:hypothetical protein
MLQHRFLGGTLMSDFAEQFKQDLAVVPWKDLRIHLQRDAIIIVAEELDLIETAIAVAEDDKAKIEGWIADQLLVKPSAEQIGTWEKQLEKPFRLLIAQPFILIQMVAHA